jgi:hypothetical protein
MNHKPTKPTILITLFAVIILQCQSVYSLQRSKQENGKVIGVVLDPNDARVKGAAITFRYGQSEWKAVSGEAGEFELELPVQTYLYHFTVQANGFCNFKGELVRVQAGRTEMINVHLEVSRTHTECRCSSRRN